MFATIFWLMSPTLSITLGFSPERVRGTVAFPFALPEALKPPQRMTRSLLTGGFPFGEFRSELLEGNMHKPSRLRLCDPSLEVAL